MPLNDIILCTLCKKGLTTVMELRQYFLQKDNKIINISKQGYLQQRRRLNYKVFSLLNKKYLQDFYLNDNKILWNGYLVFAVDGSKVEVSNSNENIAIGLFKESFLKILIEGNNQIRKKKLIKLQLLIECYTLPIRNLKCSDTRNRVTNKYKNNQKNSF